MTDITAEAQFDNFFALFEQPVQFEVGADENGREIAVNIVPLTTGEEA